MTLTLDQLSTLFLVLAAATILLTSALEYKVYRLEKRVLGDAGAPADPRACGKKGGR